MIAQSLYFLTGFFVQKNLRTVYSLEQKRSMNEIEQAAMPVVVAWYLNVHKARSV